MIHDNLLQSFLLCDDNPEDTPAWEELLRNLQRSGHNGPLVGFVQEYLRIQTRKKKFKIKAELALKAWEPLVSQGFVLFTVKTTTTTVFHIGRLGINEHFCRSCYPDGWQYGDVLGLCQAVPRLLYTSNNGMHTKLAWTSRKTPWNGHEYPPCKACLKSINRLPGDDVTQLTPEQINRIKELVGDHQ